MKTKFTVVDLDTGFYWNVQDEAAAEDIRKLIESVGHDYKVSPA